MNLLCSNDNVCNEIYFKKCSHYRTQLALLPLHDVA